jgi:hypothetical protein
MGGMSDVKATFERARQGLREVNASSGDRDLVDLLERHGAEEGAILKRYEQLSATARSESTRYLIGLILEDERRHHRVIAEIANAVVFGGYEQAGTSGAVPDLDTRSEDPDLLAVTRELIRIEKEDAAELKRIRRELKAYSETTMWALLLETMLLDTDKHKRILEFIERQLSQH